LHRKESFLNSDHPLHGKFSRLTLQEENAGLLDNTATIGTRDGWASRLRDAGFVLWGHRLVKFNEPAQTPVQNAEEQDSKEMRA
jgi:hypothetical protein